MCTQPNPASPYSTSLIPNTWININPPSVHPDVPGSAAVRYEVLPRAPSEGHDCLGRGPDYGSAPQRPWSMASGWVGGAAWPGLAGRSAVVHHSGPSPPQCGGWSGDAKHIPEKYKYSILYEILARYYIIFRISSICFSLNRSVSNFQSNHVL